METRSNAKKSKAIFESTFLSNKKQQIDKTDGKIIRNITSKQIPKIRKEKVIHFKFISYLNSNDLSSIPTLLFEILNNNYRKRTMTLI